MKILLGGIPLGCDNIGDEAILSCVVALLNQLIPEAELTVCTAQPEATARELGVNCIPLYGFQRPFQLREFRREARKHDWFLWCGATGLSDYPATALRLLRAARSAGARTLVWNVGMDSELNPAYFRLDGRKKMLLQLLSSLTGGKWNAVRTAEHGLEMRMRRQLTAELRHCAAVITRDPESAQELARGGFADAVVGADTAILQETAPENKLPPELRQWEGKRLIALCLSAQRAVTAQPDLQQWCDRLLADPENRLLFLPMNPVTDAALMDTFRAGLRHREHTLVLYGYADPAVVQLVASHCAVVVSSRLHLLILAANAGTPIVGIARGSKIDNFLRNFDLVPAGTVFDCDVAFLEREVERQLNDPAPYREHNRIAYRKLRARLEEAGQLLRQTIIPNGK